MPKTPPQTKPDDNFGAPAPAPAPAALVEAMLPSTALLHGPGEGGVTASAEPSNAPSPAVAPEVDAHDSVPPVLADNAPPPTPATDLRRLGGDSDSSDEGSGDEGAGDGDGSMPRKDTPPRPSSGHGRSRSASGGGGKDLGLGFDRMAAIKEAEDEEEEKEKEKEDDDGDAGDTPLVSAVAPEFVGGPVPAPAPAPADAPVAQAAAEEGDGDGAPTSGAEGDAEGNQGSPAPVVVLPAGATQELGDPPGTVSAEASGDEEDSGDTPTAQAAAGAGGGGDAEEEEEEEEGGGAGAGGHGGLMLFGQAHDALAGASKTVGDAFHTAREAFSHAANAGAGAAWNTGRELRNALKKLCGGNTVDDEDEPEGDPGHSPSPTPVAAPPPPPPEVAPSAEDAAAPPAPAVPAPEAAEPSTTVLSPPAVPAAEPAAPDLAAVLTTAMQIGRRVRKAGEEGDDDATPPPEAPALESPSPTPLPWTDEAPPEYDNTGEFVDGQYVRRERSVMDPLQPPRDADNVPQDLAELLDEEGAAAAVNPDDGPQEFDDTEGFGDSQGPANVTMDLLPGGVPDGFPTDPDQVNPVVGVGDLWVNQDSGTH